MDKRSNEPEGEIGGSRRERRTRGGKGEK